VIPRVPDHILFALRERRSTMNHPFYSVDLRRPGALMGNFLPVNERQPKSDRKKMPPGIKLQREPQGYA